MGGRSCRKEQLYNSKTHRTESKRVDEKIMDEILIRDDVTKNREKMLIKINFAKITLIKSFGMEALT